MSKTIKFFKREEVEEFLNKYDFKYHIPEIQEDTWENNGEGQFYNVEVSKNNKILYADVENIKNGFSVSVCPFYDVTRLKDFYTKKEWETRKKEIEEYNRLLAELE